MDVSFHKKVTGFGQQSLCVVTGVQVAREFWSDT